VYHGRSCQLGELRAKKFCELMVNLNDQPSRHPALTRSRNRDADEPRNEGSKLEAATILSLDRRNLSMA
jgi:hypothetical protein